MKRLLKTCWLAVRCVALAAALLVVGVALFAAVSFAFFAIVETPGANRFKRYCDYPNKDVLLAAETNNVVSCVDFTVGGTNITIVDVGWIGFLPSGPAMLVYDADGKLVDKTSDSGDDGCFQRKWLSAWRKAAQEKTLRWLRETRLPQTQFAVPATMADFAAHMEQASKDFDRSDIPPKRRGLRFRCGEKVGKIVFPEASSIGSGSCGEVSFWDALTNACERTGCQYNVYGGGVYIGK